MKPNDCIPEEELLLQLFRETDQPRAAVIRDHLGSCHSCSARYKELQSTVDNIPHDTPDLSTMEVNRLTEKVMQRVRRKTPGPMLQRGFAYATILGLVLFFSLQEKQPNGNPEPAAAIAEMEMIESMEFLEEMELLEHLELLEMLESRG